jgi:NADH-dependent peroxiredoxin subunit F
MNRLFDLAIIGGGPAGIAAGVYASRKRLKTLFITKDFQGQSAVSDGIENWIGTIKISGAELAKSLENHLKAYAGEYVDIKEGITADKLAKQGPSFMITTSAGTFETKTVLIASGSRRRRLEVPGADQFEHKGLTYCASCDGPIFAGQDVAVVGGGNAAFESAAQLAAYCKSVTIINRSNDFRADPVTVEKVLGKENVKALKGTAPTEVKGDKFVSALSVKDSSGVVRDLPVTGIFVEIGSLPNTAFAKDTVSLDSFGRVPVDPRTQMTATAGVWAAGDCTDGLYHQNNIAAGDAVKALEDIYQYIHSK